MKVKIAFLHSAITVPGSIHSELTLSKQKIKSLVSMIYDAKGLIVKCTNVTTIVPLANLKNVILENE